MAGVMVSASTGAMNSLLGKLATLMEEEFAKLKNLRKEVKSIGDELRSMNNFLERLADVDELDVQTKGWRDEVREMSYDIEDIVDDFKQQVTGKKDDTSGIVSRTIERMKTMASRHRIAGRIKELKKLVHETSQRHERYKLDIPAATSADLAIDQRVVALYANVADLVGVGEPADELVKLLVDEEKQLKVISVVGFGGLGKTTLANVVHRKLKGEFDCDAFVAVSQKPNVPKLLDSLLSQLIKSGESFHEYCELNVLVDKLREHLQNRRYFIVVDDLWDVSAWDVIKYAFPENNLGSRVIATTRNQDVAKACSFHQHDYIFNMKALSNEDSEKLFHGRIFGTEETCPQHLRNISTEILNKCGGLPLAIVSISSLLAVEGFNRKERWEHVRNCIGSSMSGTNLTLKGMRQILNLSYKHLPCYLKTCFLYLGMYPEDYTIRRSDLERQWIAEGFLSKTNGQDLDKVAQNYFNELVNRNLIQLVISKQIGEPDICCKVHDMMLDLILCKCAEENFITVVDDPNAITGVTHKARRLSFQLDGASSGTILPRNMSMSQVRSLMIFGSSSQNLPHMSEFKFLRVLFVKDGGSIDLTGLCKLYQLRYLRIGGNCKFPTLVRGLQHLETLEVCSSLPSDIVYLTRLLHLNTGHVERLPDGIGNIKSLRSLYFFDLGENSLDNIKGLGELTNLRNLTITCYGNPDDIVIRMDLLCISLEKLCSIELLVFGVWNCTNGLMALPPPPPPRSIEKFKMFKDAIIGSWFSRVPNWMAGLHNLSELALNVGQLLKDGVGILAELPSLIKLDLYIFRRSIQEEVVIYGRFPVLRRFELHLNRVSYLSFQAGTMPRLQWLRLEFNAQGSEQDKPRLDGVEHLSALQEFSAKIGCLYATESDRRSTEVYVRSAINNHPNHPSIEIKYMERSRCAFLDDRQASGAGKRVTTTKMIDVSGLIKHERKKGNVRPIALIFFGEDFVETGVTEDEDGLPEDRATNLLLALLLYVTGSSPSSMSESSSSH